MEKRPRRPFCQIDESNTQELDQFKDDTGFDDEKLSKLRAELDLFKKPEIGESDTEFGKKQIKKALKPLKDQIIDFFLGESDYDLGDNKAAKEDAFIHYIANGRFPTAAKAGIEIDKLERIIRGQLAKFLKFEFNIDADVSLLKATDVLQINRVLKKKELSLLRDRLIKEENWFNTWTKNSELVKKGKFVVYDMKKQNSKGGTKIERDFINKVHYQSKLFGNQNAHDFFWYSAYSAAYKSYSNLKSLVFQAENIDSGVFKKGYGKKTSLAIIEHLIDRIREIEIDIGGKPTQPYLSTIVYKKTQILPWNGIPEQLMELAKAIQGYIFVGDRRKFIKMLTSNEVPQSKCLWIEQNNQLPFLKFLFTRLARPQPKSIGEMPKHG